MEILLRIIYDLTHVHPPHTLIVHFPVALVSSALFFILLALWRRKDTIEQVAFANISLAAVSSIVALVFGIRDDIYFYSGQAPNGTAKIVLASILFIITSSLAITRWRIPNLFNAPKTRFIYVLGYFVSFLIVSVLGFLGGVILYGF
jgi:uncharacterized membrane protein